MVGQRGRAGQEATRTDGKLVQRRIHRTAFFISSVRFLKHLVMNPSLHNFRESLLKRLVDFLWQQWSALGLAGYARHDSAKMIDPEALLLFSTHIARHDSRLFDEILDWLHHNGSWINLQRLGTLHKEENLGDSAVLSAIADLLSKNSVHQKWKLLMRRVEVPSSQLAELPQKLFPSIPILKEPDPVFLKHGLQRGGIELRGMSQSPRPDQPATFLFKLRALFGMQARAEVMAWLLANQQGHPAEIARQTGYFRGSIQNVLNDLRLSGHVGSVRIGREKSFSILRHDEWRFLLTWPDANAFPQWINWAPLFRAIQIFLDALGKPELDEKSENFQAIQLREALEQATPSLVRAGRIHQMRATSDMSGTALTTALLTDLETLIP